MNNFSCPFCDTSIETNGKAYVTECEHFPISAPKNHRIPYIVSNLKNINQNSIVLDVGGFTGIFAKCMVNTFNPIMHIFEPTTKYYHILQSKFKEATIYNYGLGSYTRTETIYVDGQNTSIHQHWTKNAQKEIINLVAIKSFLDEFNQPIDLLAINCEGGEYEILPELINSTHIHRVKQILIQFHELDEYSYHQANEICKQLTKTHHQTLNAGLWKWVLFELK